MSFRRAKGNGIAGTARAKPSVGIRPLRAFYRSSKYIVWELHLSCQFRGSGFVQVTADIVGPPPGSAGVRSYAAIAGGYGRLFDFIQNHFDVCVESLSRVRIDYRCLMASYATFAIVEYGVDGLQSYRLGFGLSVCRRSTRDHPIHKAEYRVIPFNNDNGCSVQLKIGCECEEFSYSLSAAMSRQTSKIEFDIHFASETLN